MSEKQKDQKEENQHHAVTLSPEAVSVFNEFGNQLELDYSVNAKSTLAASSNVKKLNNA